MAIYGKEKNVDFNVDSHYQSNILAMDCDTKIH